MDTPHIRVAVIAHLILLLFFAAPFFVHAQNADLQTTIRAALLSDPRTSGLSAGEIDAIVAVLVGEAQKRGVTSEDIRWRPQSESSFSDTGERAQSCGNIPRFLCALNHAFGFDGSDPTIAIGLGITSAIMILLIALKQEMARRALAGATPPSPRS